MFPPGHFFGLGFGNAGTSKNPPPTQNPTQDPQPPQTVQNTAKVNGTGNIQAPIIIPGINLPNNFGFDQSASQQAKRPRMEQTFNPPGPKPGLAGQPSGQSTFQPGQNGHPSSAGQQNGQPPFRPGQQNGQPPFQQGGQPSYQAGQQGGQPSHQAGQQAGRPSYSAGQQGGQPSFQAGQQGGQQGSQQPSHQSGQQNGQPSFQQGQPSFQTGQQNGPSSYQQQFQPGYQGQQTGHQGHQGGHHGQQGGHPGQQGGHPGQQGGQYGYPGQQGGQHNNSSFANGQQFLPNGQNYMQPHNQVFQQIYNTNHSGQTVNNTYNLSTLPSNVELRNLNVSDSQFREWFPNLGAMTFAHQMSTIQVLCSMELKASGKMRAIKPLNPSLEDQFRENLQMLTVEKVWDPEVDNKYDLLHGLRFDRAPIIGSEKLFQMAAERYKPGDIPPISAYDLTSLGLSDVVITARGISNFLKFY